MPHTAFSKRLAYLRWLDGLGRLSQESDAEFAARVGVTYGWLKKWMRRDDSPVDRHKAAALAAAFDDAPVGRWLLDEEGAPPRPDLWAIWEGQNPVGHYLEVAEKHGLPLADRNVEEVMGSATAKGTKRAGGGRRT